MNTELIKLHEQIKELNETISEMEDIINDEENTLEYHKKLTNEAFYEIVNHFSNKFEEYIDLLETNNVLSPVDVTLEKNYMYDFIKLYDYIL